jgi:lipopolysaccharide transport system ATP-binding protein
MNSENIAISVNAISKRYFNYENPQARLRHAFWPTSTRGISETWALRDVTFNVARGEAVGIVGRNGGGKSTLLEIITGTLQPTSGSVRVNGSVAALLELGSGFNPEFTGRENVFLNGLLQGLSRAEVEHRFDEIAGFADIGDVLDQPVKYYSSGMLVRLAFAVQVALAPDILIVDEALSVGDYFFQQKCFGRLRQMRDKGLTLLFVSHDTGTVRNICSKALYLQKGNQQFFGDSKTAIRRYLSEDMASEVVATANDVAVLQQKNKQQVDVSEISCLPALWSNNDMDGNRRLLAVVVRDGAGKDSNSIRMGERITVAVYFRTMAGEHGHLSLSIKNKFDQIVSNLGSARLDIPHVSTGDAPYGIFEFSFDCNFEAGLYSLMVGFGYPQAPNRGISVEQTEWFGPLSVYWDYENDPAPFLGMFGIPCKGKLLL